MPESNIVIFLLAILAGVPIGLGLGFLSPVRRRKRHRPVPESTMPPGEALPPPLAALPIAAPAAAAIEPAEDWSRARLNETSPPAGLVEGPPEPPSPGEAVADGPGGFMPGGAVVAAGAALAFAESTDDDTPSTDAAAEPSGDADVGVSGDAAVAAGAALAAAELTDDGAGAPPAAAAAPLQTSEGEPLPAATAAESASDVGESEPAAAEEAAISAAAEPASAPTEPEPDASWRDEPPAPRPETRGPGFDGFGDWADEAAVAGPAAVAGVAAAKRRGKEDSVQPPLVVPVPVSPGPAAESADAPGVDGPDPFDDPRDILEIEGIGPAYAARLRANDINSVGDMFRRVVTEPGRVELQQTAKVSRKRLLTWVNHADLMRVPGITTHQAELLEAAGVDSPAELMRRDPANLAVTVAALNEERHLAPETPDEATVEGWIEAAKRLPKLVTH